MADAEFPGQHTTSTATNTQVQRYIRYDRSYLLTIPGYLKLAQITCSFIGFFAIAVSGTGGYVQARFFDSVSGFAFWFSGIMLVFYLFHVIETYYKIPWLKIELGFCAVWTVLYLITSTMVASLISVSAALGVSALCGYGAMVLYGYDAWLKYQGVILGHIGQGDRTEEVQKSTSPTTSPAY